MPSALFQFDFRVSRFGISGLLILSADLALAPVLRPVTGANAGVLKDWGCLSFGPAQLLCRKWLPLPAG